MEQDRATAGGLGRERLREERGGVLAGQGRQRGERGLVAVPLAVEGVGEGEKRIGFLRNVFGFLFQGRTYAGQQCLPLLVAERGEGGGECRDERLGAFAQIVGRVAAGLDDKGEVALAQRGAGVGADDVAKLLFGAQLGEKRLAEKIAEHEGGGAGGGRVVGQEAVLDEGRVHAGDETGIDDVFSGAEPDVAATDQGGFRRGGGADFPRDGTRGGDGGVGREVTVDEDFDFAGSEEGLGKSLHIGPSGGGGRREQFVGRKDELTREGVAAILGEFVGFGLGVAAQAAEERVLHRLEPLRGQRERAELRGEIGRVEHGRVAKTGDLYPDALEGGLSGDRKSREGGCVGVGGERVAEARAIEREERGVLGGGHRANGDEAIDQRGLRPEKFGFTGVEKMQAGLGDQGQRALGQERGARGHEAVGRGQGEGDLGRLLEGGVGRAGVFAVRVGRAVDALGLIGRDALGHEGDEQVVGGEDVEQAAVGGFVGGAPHGGRALGDFERVEQGLVGELGRELGSLAAVAVGLVEGGDACAVAVVVGGKWGRTEVIEVTENQAEHAGGVFATGGRERDADDERTVGARALPETRADAVGEALGLEQRLEATGAGVADELGEELVGLTREIGARGRHGELEFELADFLDGLDQGEAQGGFAWQKIGRAGDGGRGAAENRAEERTGEFLEFVERGLAGEAEGHAVGRVVLLIKGADVGGRGAGERVLVARGKFTLVAAGGVEFTGHADLAPKIVLHVAHGLVVDGVDFAPGELGAELRRDEELGETIERAGERLVADVELVVRMVAGGVGVVHPAVLAEVGIKVGDVGILLRAEEQHVLEEVGESLTIRRVVDLADVHDEGRAGFVEFLVGDEQDAQAVIEDEAAELRGVGRRDDAGR